MIGQRLEEAGEPDSDDLAAMVARANDLSVTFGPLANQAVFFEVSATDRFYPLMSAYGNALKRALLSLTESPDAQTAEAVARATRVIASEMKQASHNLYELGNKYTDGPLATIEHIIPIMTGGSDKLISAEYRSLIDDAVASLESQNLWEALLRFDEPALLRAFLDKLA